MMVKFKGIVLASLMLTSVGLSNSQTRVFDLNGAHRQVAPIEATQWQYQPESNTVSVDVQENVRLQGVRQSDGSVIFHQVEEDDLLFTKEEDGTVVDQYGNVVEDAQPEFELDPFYRAVTSQNVQQLQLMLSSGQNPNVVFDDGNTAMHLAAYYKNRDMLHLLLWYNASVNVKNSEKATALHLLCAYGTKEMLDQVKTSLGTEFIKALNTEGAYKRNCLHYAMMYSTDDLLINSLLASGMKASHVSEEGHTPAHSAAMMSHWDKVALVGEHDISLLKIKGAKGLEEKTTEDLMYERMGILKQLDYFKYFSEEKQDLLNVKFNKAHL